MRSHGLLVVPKSSLKLCRSPDQRGRLVLPKTIAPASLRRATAGASTVGTWSVSSTAPPVERMPGRLDGVLDRDRQAVQRSAAGRPIAVRASAAVGGGQRRLGGQRDDGVERGVEPLDAVEVELEQLAALDLGRGSRRPVRWRASRPRCRPARADGTSATAQPLIPLRSPGAGGRECPATSLTGPLPETGLAASGLLPMVVWRTAPAPPNRC